MKINVLDLFSGIGGFSQGLKQAGFDIENHYYSEIDKHAQAIYKKQFPTAKAIGDVRHVRGSELGRINAITFGSPCQDFSLAGKRKGMDGERSSLITEAIRLITECKPDFFIWENVKGTFSSNSGADFWAIVKAFANIGGYRIEWQLLNTAWLLPQNRERIYLVGRLADRCSGQVFPITENTKRIDERSKQATNVRTLTAGGNSGGLHSSMTLIKSIHGEDHEGTIVPYSMGSGKKGRSCIGAQRVPEIGDENHSIRRLTEIECERLQGFKDDWTRLGLYPETLFVKYIYKKRRQKAANDPKKARNKQIPLYRSEGLILRMLVVLYNKNRVVKKEVSASQRYKCLGNAVTVDVVQAVGERILRGFES